MLDFLEGVFILSSLKRAESFMADHLDFKNNFALGGDITVNQSSAFGYGRLIEINIDESMVFGYGNPNPTPSVPLRDIGSQSITMGLNAQNILNLKLNSSNDPVVGIGTTSPGTDKLRIVGNGTGTNAALNVQNSNNDNRFNVRNDGATGFIIPANPGRPRAPYQFEESEFSPFQNGPGGKANIVQNYASFPNFKDAGGPNPPGDEAKWLALGERPPGKDEQIAYGLANVWENNAGNLILLDKDPERSSGQSDDKDVAITFQDTYWDGQDQALTNPENAGNRLRFLFRNSKTIQNSGSKFEIMSLEPTGEVGIGDYSGNSTQQANLEVKAETQGNGDPVFQVRNNGGPGSRGNNILTVNDDGRVGIGLTNPNDQLEVTTDDPIKATMGDWAGASDKRLKKNIDNYKDGLQELMEIRPVWYQFNSKMDHLNSDEKHVGVIAQETEEVAPYMVEKNYEINGKNYYSLNSTAFTYMLINAVQEQQKQLKDEQKKNDSMRQVLKNQQEQLNNQKQQLNNQQVQIDQLRDKLNRLAKQNDGNANRFKKSDDLKEKTVSITAEDNQKQAMLLQNRPNPYSGETIIPYYLPKDFETANILITNTNGQMIKRVNLEQSGKGELTLRTQGLNSGQYFYSLTIDGQKIQTRKMVKSRK